MTSTASSRPPFRAGSSARTWCKKLKVGFNIPVYVLEYLLGKYCSTTNEAEID